MFSDKNTLNIHIDIEFNKNLNLFILKMIMMKNAAPKCKISSQISKAFIKSEKAQANIS